MTQDMLPLLARRSACVLSLVLLACGGPEFSPNEPGAASGGTGGTAGEAPGGGTGAAGAGASASGGVGAAAGGTGGSAGEMAGGAGGEAGTGVGGAGNGGAPALPNCGPPGSSAPRLYTTLDNSLAILKPNAGAGPGAANGSFAPGVCGQALLVGVPGHYISYPALGNVSIKRGTLDLWMLPNHEPKDGKPHQLLFVPGKLNIAKDDLGRLGVGMTDASGKPVSTLVSAASVSYKAGTWVRVSVTWDFASPGQNVHVYFDGVEANAYIEASAGPHTMAAIGSGEPMVIGARSDSGPEPIAATLDDVKVFDTVQPI